MNRHASSFLAVVFTLLAACLHGCIGGTEIPDEIKSEVKGTVVVVGSGPAAGIAVKLVPIAYRPGDLAKPDSSRPAIYSAMTVADGHFSIQGVDSGKYNVLASKDGLYSFRDSVSLTGKAQALGVDTLRLPGSLRGVVGLQPQHDMRTAMVEVIGTQVYVNVAVDGAFLLPPMGEGEYRLRVSSTIEGYTPLFADIRMQSAASDLVPDTLRPFYSGIPVVTGLAAAPGPDGIIRLSWKRPDYPQVQAYLVYRDSAGFTLPSDTPLRRVEDTVFADTLFSKTPHPGQIPWLDSLSRGYSYRVRVMSLTGEIGPSFGSATAVIAPPERPAVRFRWNRVVESAPFGPAVEMSMISYRDTLYLLGSKSGPAEADSLPSQSWLSLWQSADGITWIPSPRGLRLRHGAHGKLAILDDRLVISCDVLINDPVFSTRVRNHVYLSRDSGNWDEAVFPASFTHRRSPALAAAEGRLYLLGSHVTAAGIGPGEVLLTDVWSMTMADPWREETKAAPHAQRAAALGFVDRIWILGGGQVPSSPIHSTLHASPDGKNWTPVQADPLMLPRSRASAAVHDGRLWLVGGHETGNRLADVWSSPDGAAWSPEAFQAEFGKRLGVTLASFKGKLWLVGGSTVDEVRGAEVINADIWRMD